MSVFFIEIELLDPCDSIAITDCLGFLIQHRMPRTIADKSRHPLLVFGSVAFFVIIPTVVTRAGFVVSECRYGPFKSDTSGIVPTLKQAVRISSLLSSEPTRS